MLIAGPNLTIDRILRLSHLSPGQVLRSETAESQPGGKGINVARMARRLDTDPLTVSFVGGQLGVQVARQAKAEGLRLVGIHVADEIRSATIVLEKSGRVTVVNEPGPTINKDDWDRYFVAIQREVPKHRVFACCGSLPPGAPLDAYARLVSLGKEQSSITIVDASGPVLATALRSRPDFVTPNLAEAEGVLSSGADSEATAMDVRPHGDIKSRALKAATQLVSRGCRTCVVTAGAAGAAVATATGSAWINAPRIREANPIGAGDAFVAGLASALEQGHTLPSALSLGIAAGAASAESSPASVDIARVRELEKEISAHAARIPIGD